MNQETKLFHFLIYFLFSALVLASERKVYQVCVRIEPPVSTTVVLHGATTPFQAVKQSGPDGKFCFKKVPPDVYNILVLHPRHGKSRMSAHVGPNTANSQGKIDVIVKIQTERLASQDTMQVKVQELAIPEKAEKQYDQARNCLTRNNIACAISHLEKSVEIAPQFTTAWNHLGTISYQSRRYEDAVKYF
jgi:tetratricopeptide (TPR) repeat protein